ncbi:MAG: hypothetical protein ABW212_08550, partial [Pseudonocardia sediminis]
MLHDLLRIPITGRDVLVPVDVIALVLTLWVVVAPLLRRTGTRRSAHPLRAVLVRVGGLVVGAGLGLVAVWWTGDELDLFGVAFTPVTRMWIAFAFAGVALLVVVLVQGGWTLRVVALGAAACVALAAGLGVNVDFGFYKNVEQAVATNPYPTRTLHAHHDGATRAAVVDAADWHAPADMPREGETLSVRIPGTVSHFHARKAVVWLPPAARTAHPPELPVLVSLSGQPGQPADMFQTGDLGVYLEHYAATHDGLA